MLLVTMHGGGSPDKHPHRNNVQAYDKDGKKLSTGVLEDSPGVTLDELRGLYLHSGILYVVNANKNENSVLCYSGSDLDYKFAGKFASPATCAGILHPFDLTFDGAGNAYVSSQDTNIVTRLKVSANGRTGAPAVAAPALPANGKFFPGTFVASSKSIPNINPSTTPVQSPGGLEYSDDGPKKHSVRGVVWANGALYVADQPSRHIKVYDKNGKYLGQSNGLESPVHVTVWNGNVYVTGGDYVHRGKLPNPPGDFTVSAIKELNVKNSSGIAFTDKGHIY